MTTDEEIMTIDDVDKAKADNDILKRLEALEAEQKKNLETIAKLQEANKGLYARLTAEPKTPEPVQTEPQPESAKEGCDAFLHTLYR